ncbi:oligosaccharide flippase family protein [Vibrio comitans]|uniref:O-antigen translocase n=1 Tax=Vibrio comitans NBRC 102076 TaxID=1219078 RepID=A0A4Y3ISI1_9VIBR|nr:oligosaccharide flippase family protein [Vibrio comitans]GEA62005.1 O-antigen translocase [Vibrio comitans NBRC 102076]
MTHKKHILKGASIIGSASVVTIIISLFKVKILALYVGPVGVGTMGLLMTVLSLATTIVGFGINTACVRELAHNNKPGKMSLIRRSVNLVNVIIGFITILIVYIFKAELSILLFNSDSYEIEVILLSVGVLLSLISSAQLAFLQGYRKLKEIAKYKIYSAILSSVIGLTIIYILGNKGVIYFVLSLPFFSVVMGAIYSKRLPSTGRKIPNMKEVLATIKPMINVGTAFMLAAIMNETAKLFVRKIVNDNIGIESVGQYQAAWSISMTYIGFILTAMAADYYPRLSKSINDSRRTFLNVNRQLEMSLLLASPFILILITFSNPLVYLLYSSEFKQSGLILKWQALGDIFKIMGWSLGFLLVAKGKGLQYFLTEAAFSVTYVMLINYGISNYDVEITGYAFVLAYFVYLVLLYRIVKITFRIKIARVNVTTFLVLFLVSSLVLFTHYYARYLSYFIGCCAILFSLLKAYYYVSNSGLIPKSITRKISV